jgi:transposase
MQVHRLMLPKVIRTILAERKLGSPFGPGIKAAVAYLHGGQMVGFKRLTELCEGLFGLTISQGAISNMLARMGEPFGAAAEQIAAIVRSSEVIASDETSARVKGKTHWQWTFGCATAVYHVIAPTRGKCVPTDFLAGARPKCGCRIACRRSAHTPRRTSFASRI